LSRYPPAQAGAACLLSLPANLTLPCQIRDSGKNFSAVGWQFKIDFFSNQLKLMKLLLILSVLYFGINLATIINALKRI
jgi:hypothetical protein